MRNTRDFGLHRTGAGKGDKERSPGWRKNYDEINWGAEHPKENRRFHKKYGPHQEPKEIDLAPKIIVH